jgi:hypothetical protein
MNVILALALLVFLLLMVDYAVLVWRWMVRK